MVVAPIAATPSPRSDWPAAIGQHRAAADPRPREEGTDGLMGRLPFGLPGDTPYARPEPVNRFMLDDIRTSWSGFDSTPPWVRSVAASRTSGRTRSSADDCGESSIAPPP